ncbi:MAG: hypothetical protein HBSAPP04_00680 [Ignavibacteriaceae bacterium]|nr:MAG: hypothetical protein HBSAPP04_00680 [Ignavibacteriaceae bacterium]
MKGWFNYVDIGSIDSELKQINSIQKINWGQASSRARQIIRQGDTLFSTVRVNLERIAYVEDDITDAIASTGFTVLRGSNAVDPRYLFYAVTRPSFIKKLVRLQKGTAYPAVTDKIIFDQEIPLPPLQEQKQLVNLFQTIDQAIDQVENQQSQLLQLRHGLCDGLIFGQPYFGDMLSNESCLPLLLEAFADSIEEHDKAKTDITRFVGLENIEPGEFIIKSWGNIEDGTTFTKRFRVGDVLFGKRRAYLKKVAVATFDGICSSDILVLRAKPEKILPGLLPFYISADPFIEYAVTTSAGSLSPRTKWKDLAKFEISLPDLKTQEKILSVLQGIETTRLQLTNQKANLKKLKQQLLNEILG